MNKEQLTKKAKSTNALNLWAMILGWINVAFSLVIGFIFGFNLAKNNGEITVSDAAINTVSVISWILLIATLTVTIVAAVYNNNKSIRELYKNAQRGTAAPVLSILAAVFTYFGIGFIFSTIVFFTTKNVLKTENK